MTQQRRNKKGAKESSESPSLRPSTEPISWATEVQTARLPLPEICTYITIWISAVVYALYSVYVVSLDAEEVLNDYDLVTGWSWTGRRKDASNFEWDFYLNWFWHVWPWYAGHILLGRVVTFLCPQWRKHLYLLYSVISLCFILGHKSVLLVLAHCMLSLFASLFKSVVFVWIMCLALLSTLNFHPFTEFMKLACDNDPFEKKYYLLMFSLAMTNIRCISLSIEWCHARKAAAAAAAKKSLEKEETAASAASSAPSYSFISSLHYIFYLPLFFCGPVMTFDEFDGQMSKPQQAWTRQMIGKLSLDWIRIIFWGFFSELILHYFYFNSIQQDMSLLSGVSLWSLAGLGYCHGQFFMVKYFVIAGALANLARLDQLEPPKGPRCISWVYLYSQMWRCFDRGLYNFIKRYIFLPLRGSKSGFLRSWFASLACFAFVFYWHGAEGYLLTWTVLNFVGVSLESTGSKVMRVAQVQELERSYLLPSWSRRLRAIVAVPMLHMSAIAIFFFLGGGTVGHVFYTRLLTQANGVTLLTQFGVFYCCIQTAKEIERWKFSHEKKKRD